MNFDYWMRRLAGKSTCHLAPGARLVGGARIRNIGRGSELISVGSHTLIAGELLVFPQGGKN